jgi:excisionase family DNA binding protein
MLYTVREVANLLKVNRNFVYDEIKNGKLRAIRVGSIKIRHDDLEAYINQREVVINGVETN